jgi:hypothetical protein
MEPTGNTFALRPQSLLLPGTDERSLLFRDSRMAVERVIDTLDDPVRFSTSIEFVYD